MVLQTRKFSATTSFDPVEFEVDRSDYSRLSNANATSSLIQNFFPNTPEPCISLIYEPCGSQLLPSHSKLLCRNISENRALATWTSLIIFQGKLVLDDAAIVFDELALQNSLAFKLTKSFQLLNPPTPAILVAILYLYRVFPYNIPYCGNPDDECAIALHRLFLLCLRLALQWFEDQSEKFDFRGRPFQWHVYLALEKAAFQNADINLLYLLDHDLCVSNIAYARWLSHLFSTLPEYLGNYLAEYRLVSHLIDSVRPPLTPEFLHLDRLPCTGLPFDEAWFPAPPSLEEFAERGRDLMDCLTFGLAIPLYVQPRAPLTGALEATAKMFMFNTRMNDSLDSISGLEGTPSPSDTDVDVSASPPPCALVQPRSSSSPSSETGSLVDFLKDYKSLKRSQLPKSPFPGGVIGHSLVHSISKAFSTGPQTFLERLWARE